MHGVRIDACRGCPAMHRPYNNPMNQHHRHSIRLPGYDYTQPGAYFVTMCTHNRETLFGEIVSDVMQLNAIGEIVHSCWNSIPRHFPFTAPDVYVIMPNHFHAIVWIVDRAGRGDALLQSLSRPGCDGHASPLQPVLPNGTEPGSLSAIVQNFKSISARRINQARQTPASPVWQRNFYERIIRNDGALRQAREYIGNNPLQWALDRENPHRATL